MTRRLARSPLFVLLLGLASLAGGCLTRAEGKRLAREGAERERRLRALEEGIDEERARLREEVERAQAKVAELRQVLEEATKVVKRNSADLGYEVEQLQQKIAELEGALAEVRNEIEQMNKKLGEQRTELEERIEGFARRAGLDMPLEDAEIPSDKKAHFEAAREAVRSGNHSKGRALLREYLRRYGSDGRADDAQYWIGRSYVDQGKPATALGELRKVISDHGDGDVVDDALLAMSEAFYALHSCSDAKSALEALLRAHPRSPLAGEAKKRLRKIRKAPRSYCTN